MLARNETTFFCKSPLTWSRLTSELARCLGVSGGLERAVRDLLPALPLLLLLLLCLKGHCGLLHGHSISSTSSLRILRSCSSWVVSSQNSRDSVDDFLLRLSSVETCTHERDESVTLAS